MQSSVPTAVKPGLFTIWNVSGWFGETCNMVLEPNENGTTHLWGRFDKYIGMKVYFYVEDVNVNNILHGVWTEMPMVWRARSMREGVVLADERVVGTVQFKTEEKDGRMQTNIEVMLRNGALGREAWVEGKRYAEHDEETGNKLLQEIKAEWIAMASDPRQAKLENVQKDHGALYEYSESGRRKL